MADRGNGGIIGPINAPTDVKASGLWTLEEQKQARQVGKWPSGGYQIQRSLRFNSADSAYLNRTPASAGNRQTWTWSGWVKRSVFGEKPIFSAGSASNPRGSFSFNADDTIYFYDQTDNTFVVTAAVFRDSSAWYHAIVAYDSTQATNTNRIKIYINGVQQTIGGTPAWPAQNYDSVFNNNITHQIGSYIVQNFYDGYMTEVNFIDGQALTPSSFGEYNADTGVWQPKRYAGSYGTNGFYLNFSDNSNTTAATLGADYSGNGNNWTPNNFSVSAGAGNDSLVDVPTNWGVDTGVGGTVRGNYCTLNPLDNGGLVLANGNLQFNRTEDGWRSTRATFGMSTGKWYWESTITSTSGTTFCQLGVALSSADLPTYFSNTTAGFAYESDALKLNGSFTGYGASYGVNDVIGVAFDADAGTLTFYKNGVSQGVAFSGMAANTYFPAVGLFGIITSNINFGQRPFAYTAPSGFKALNTQNLPTPTIGATPATQAGKFFNPVLYTGNAGTLAVSGVGFQPDLVWLKGRSVANQHGWFDAVRGATKMISSESTSAEGTFITTLTSFDSDGFALGSNTTYNNNTGTFVAWNWKANGAGVTNTAGSITSTVSANTTSGFSVVTCTTQSSGTGTVGHGLGVAPAMIITKARGISGSWTTYHASLGNTQAIYLNLTDAAATVSTVWNNTSPTSSVFTFGAGFAGSISVVAYCFAEVPGYSKFGSYTGNGSADGAFVFTGFRPRYLMIKISSNAGNWNIYDTSRDVFNQSDLLLLANTSDAEFASVNKVDILSNGFKLRSNNSGTNGSGNSYIFMAFAEAPQKFALAR